MMFKKYFLAGFFATLLLGAAQNAFADFCTWTLDDGTTVVQNISGSIRTGLSEKYIPQLDACCNVGPAYCSKYMTDDEGYYNVQLAAKYNRTKTLKYFLKYRDCGATVDRFRTDSYSPGEFNALMYAIKNENSEMVKWLLYFGAKAVTKNYMGRDAKYYVEQIDQTKNADLVKMVMDAWNKEMGYSQNLINRKKEDLKKELNGQKIKEMLQKIQVQYNNPFVS